MTDPENRPEDPRASAKSAERLEEARRRLFEPPPAQPFWATPEFRRMGGLIFLLVMVGMGGLMVYWNRLDAEQKLAEEEAAHALEGAPNAPTPERAQTLSMMFQGALEDTKNGDGFRESSGYSNLLRELAAYTPEQVTQKSQRWLAYDSAMKDPDGWRGTFVRVRGLVAAVRATRLDTPVLGVKDVWRGYMSQGDKTEKVVFDLLSEPPPIKPYWDAWDVEGVFYRTVKFEDNDGNTWEVPYILAKAIRPAEAPSKLGILKSPIVMLLAVVGLALFVARLLLLLAKTRRPAPPSAAAQIRRMMTLEQARKSSPPTPPPSS